MALASTWPDVDRQRIERIVSEVLSARFLAPGATAAESPLVVNISVRHMHICQAHLDVLFGTGAQLTPQRWLYQQGQFASEQTVDLVGPKRRMLTGVRILGPLRPHSQIELAFSDAINLGIQVPVRMSGKIDGTPGCIVLGPQGHLILPQGVIRAQRHAHLSPADAQRFGVQHGDELTLAIEHPTCAVTLGGIRARIDAKFKLEVHIDSDEGNACDLPGATGMRLAKAQT
jgi:putative phosphotransacetylase